MSINYKNKDEGMLYQKNGTTYVVQHGIFKVITTEENGEFIKIHIQNHDYDCLITPYIDKYINLTPGCFIKIAYILEDNKIICHGYELTEETIDNLPEPKNLNLNTGVINIDAQELFLKLQANFTAKIQDDDIRKLVNFIITKEKDKFITYPAAVSVHHNIPSGLLLHTYNVVRNAVTIANNYSDIDMDLVIAGAILHDIGKVYEYTPEGTISQEGAFADHISIGSRLLMDTYQVLNLPIPDKDIDHLNHIILSHHGKLEWGSTKVPATKEALIVHQADYIDTQMYIYHEELKNLSLLETNRNKYAGAFIVQTKLGTSDTYCQ